MARRLTALESLLAFHATVYGPKPFKRCSCCAQSYTAESWEALDLVAAAWDVGGDGIDVFEIRNCTCGSTISMPADWRKVS